MEFPIIRKKPDSRKYPKGSTATPGQTMMLCPVDGKILPFSFTPDDRLLCTKCGFSVAREEAT